MPISSKCDAQQRAARDAVADVLGGGFAAQLVPLGLEIKRHQQLADLPHQRADHRFFRSTEFAALGHLPRDRAGQQRAVQFELGIDTARRAVMKVIDEFQPDHEMADRVHAEDHQRARDGRDVAAERDVHRGIGEPQHLLREAEVRQNDLDEGRKVQVVVAHGGYRGAQGLREHGEIPALAHARPQFVQ